MGISIITNSSPLSEIGAKTLSAYMKYHHIKSRVIYLDNILSDKLEDGIKEKILKIIQKDELVGFSLMTKDYFLFRDLSEFIRNKINIPIVWGGIHPSVCPEESLQCCDYVCIGEGEELLLNLYKLISAKKQVGDLDNLIYKSEGVIRYPKSISLLNDLNKLPYPDYEFKDDFLVKEKKILKINNLGNKEKRRLLGETLLFYSQRGCPFSCTYCSNSFLKKIITKKTDSFYRRTGVERIINELSSYIAILPFLKKVVINDDDFLARSEEEIKIFSEKYKEKINLPFWVNAIPHFVTGPKIKSLINAGLCQISMGVQTGSERILKEVYKRHLYPREIIKSSRVINKYKKKLKASYDLIVDNPYENENDILETVGLLNKLPKPYDLQIHSLVFFPGTELYQRAVKDGLIINKDEQIYHKRYQIDIGSSYLNFILVLNSLVNLPKKINNFLSSSFMRKNIFLEPWRFCLSKGVKALIILKGIKSLFLNPQLLVHYFKQLKIKIEK